MLTLIDDRSRHSELLNRLNTMRISKAFCDVTIVVDNKEFLAHKVILASSSDYFLSKFTENLKCDRLSLNLNKETFSLLLNYFYTSNLFVPREMVPGLFIAAKYLKVRRVVKGCSQYLTTNLSLENVLSVREAVSLNNNEQLCHSANEFIKENMGIIMSAPRTIKLSIDIIVEAVPKKEADFHLSELVVDWLEYAMVDGNMTFVDFSNENFVLFLTKDNSLVQYNEISSHKFPSTFLKDYFNKFFTNQKGSGKRMKGRTRSKELPFKKIYKTKSLNKTNVDQGESTTIAEKDVIIISSDDPSDILLNGIIAKNSEKEVNILNNLVQEQDSAMDYTAVLLNCEDVDVINDDDLISNSIKSKMSARPEEESCVISVESFENSDNDCVCLKINCIAKVCGKVICLSLHVKSVMDILNQSINDGETSVEMSLFYGLYKQSHSTTAGSESTTSGMSSSSVSAASSMLHVDCIAGFNANEDSLNNVESSSLYEVKNEEKSMVIQQFLKNVQNKVTSLSPCALLSTPRCAAGLVNIDDELIAIGGFNRGECLNSVEVYNPHVNTWNTSVPMNTSRARLVALPLLRNNITSVYAVGGSDGYKELATVERFDFDIQSWCQVANLKQARSYHGGCVLSSETSAVVVGGCFGPNSLRSCEIYDSIIDKWSDLSPMKIGRNQAAVSYMGQRIIVVGGTDNWKCISSCEAMDPREGKWHPMAELSCPRRGAALVSYEGKLYLFGGSDGQSSLRSLEIFDPIANQWCISGSQMKQLRANVSGSILQNKIVAIGGFTGKHFLNTMECIDFIDPNDINEWSMFVPPEWFHRSSNSMLSNECTIDTQGDTMTSDTSRELWKQFQSTK